MADTNSTAPQNHTILTNTHGTMVFSDGHELRNFAGKTSTRLASMLHVLSEVHRDIDDGFMADMLELANDLAFQLQESIAVLAAADKQA